MTKQNLAVLDKWHSGKFLVVAGLLAVAISLADGQQPQLARQAATSPASTPCPHNAVFLALEDQIRGYSLRANGSVAPCQIIEGSNTTLQTSRAVAVSINGYLHTAQFLTNGSVTIFPATANGNVAPSRTVQVETNDLVAIAIDSRVNDFIATNRSAVPTILVLPSGSSGLQPNPVAIQDPNLQFVGTVAIDRGGDLLVGGYDSNGICTIDTFATSHTLKSPPLLRTLKGSVTGLFPLNNRNAALTNPVSIAVDPSTNELYVYNTSDRGAVQVSIFASKAFGNVAPIRLISGAATSITGPGFIGTDKIALSSDGRLFVAEPTIASWHLRLVPTAMPLPRKSFRMRLLAQRRYFKAELLSGPVSASDESRSC
jgi:hypothetical protein